MFVLVLLLQLMVVLLQVFGCLLQLPPILATHHLLWLCTAAIPLLSLTMVANPLDTSIMSYALGKNKNHLVKQVRQHSGTTLRIHGCDRKLHVYLTRWHWHRNAMKWEDKRNSGD